MQMQMDSDVAQNRGALGLGMFPGVAPPAAGTLPQLPPSATRKRVWMLLTNGGIALALRCMI